MLIIVGKKNIILNPTCIVSFYLSKGKSTAFFTGETVEGEIRIEDLTVREPWTVVIETIKGTHYINCATYKEAIDVLVELIVEVYRVTDIKTLEALKKEMEKRYGKE